VTRRRCPRKTRSPAGAAPWCPASAAFDGRSHRTLRLGPECFASQRPRVARYSAPRPELAQRLKQSLSQSDVDEEIALMRTHEVNLVIAGEPGYPTTLSEIATPPPCCTWPGNCCRRMAGRSPSSVRGRAAVMAGAWPSALAGDFVRAGLTVVSGLARGIDGSAHRGAFECRRADVGGAGESVEDLSAGSDADLPRKSRRAGR